MPPLVKATLEEIGGTGDPIPVQFNPQSLKLGLANRLDKRAAEGQQRRQYLGMTSTTLSFDLHFDTADEGTTDTPVSVRTKTATIERFVLPKGDKQKPPKARFTWGDFRIDGIIEDLAIDFDLFAADGTPLRAKLTVTMKEQNPKYQMSQIGPGANRPDTGESGTGPGTSGAGPTDSTRPALQGESAADFTARFGLDPTAWRGIAGQLQSTLSLPAGLEVDFSSSLSTAAGIGVSVGHEAGAAASLEASFGLDARASVAVPAGVALGAGASAGFALSAAGGVSAAIETVNILRAETAATAARRAFGAPPATPPLPAAGGTAPIPSRGVASISPVAAVTATAPHAAAFAPSPAAPDQPRAPLASQGMPSPGVQADAPPAPAPPLADPRAVSFGAGVPLRPRVGSAADLRSGAAAGRIPLKPHAHVTQVLEPADPSAPPWSRLPVDRSRAFADAAQQTRWPARPCGCMGRCHHGGRVP
jgi:hypothetical protein